uniref:Uncharacterized protein n=1 Tax=Picea glauca TaxID=3330 RepID=A0A101M1B6_PICGL|nr:hypothetical protein ABT39_MTgene3642 [Picea glauca]
MGFSSIPAYSTVGFDIDDARVSVRIPSGFVFLALPGADAVDENDLNGSLF